MLPWIIGLGIARAVSFLVEVACEEQDRVEADDALHRMATAAAARRFEVDQTNQLLQARAVLLMFQAQDPRVHQALLAILLSASLNRHRVFSA